MKTSDMGRFKNELVKHAQRVVDEINNLPMITVECDTKVFGVIKTKMKDSVIYSNYHCWDDTAGVDVLLDKENWNEGTQSDGSVQKQYGIKIRFENEDELVLSGTIDVVSGTTFTHSIFSSRMDGVYSNGRLNKRFATMELTDIIKDSYSQLKLKHLRSSMV